MPARQPFKTCAWIAAAGFMLAACANQKGPAQKLVKDIETTVNSAAPDAARYAPDQLSDVEKKLGDLKASLDKRDYKTVVKGAPPVMGAAQALASAAAAKKDQVTRGLHLEWIGLATALPGDATALQSRIDFLSKIENKKLASGVDLGTAESSLNDATSVWSSAQAAFAGGRLEEAVAIGNSAKTKLEALAKSMRLDFTQPAAVQDTSLSP
jgi:hypothetical protein